MTLFLLPLNDADALYFQLRAIVALRARHRTVCHGGDQFIFYPCDLCRQWDDRLDHTSALVALLPKGC